MSQIKDLWLTLREEFDNGIEDARLALLELGDPYALRFVGPTLDAVADYLDRGFSVVPQLTGEKKPRVRWKPFQSLPATPALCWEWWTQWKDSGVALILGPVSNLFVIDVDGEPAHRELVRRLGGLPEAPMVISGSGKQHRYHLLFRHPEIETKAKQTPWHTQLEFRGRGGIVIAPPSKHKSGNRYRWEMGRSLDDMDPPSVPEPILVALRTANRWKSPVVSTTAPLDTSHFPHFSRATDEFVQGKFANGPNWNERLFVAACDLAGNGVDIGRAEEVLLAGAQPWNERELAAALATIESAYSQPRQPAGRINKRKLHPAIAREVREWLRRRKKDA